jgi:hypothetical protein
MLPMVLISATMAHKAFRAFRNQSKQHTSLAPLAQGLLHVLVSMGSESYFPALASTCTPLEFTPAPALAPPTFALTPMSHCDLQHFSESLLQELHPNEQHPAPIDAMATAIATAIRLTFMAYLTFFNSVLPETISGSDNANLTPFLFCRQWGTFNSYTLLSVLKARRWPLVNKL